MVDIELTRIALPRRVYTVSHMEYAIDRINWLYKHRNLVKGLKFMFEPPDHGLQDAPSSFTIKQVT